MADALIMQHSTRCLIELRVADNLNAVSTLAEIEKALPQLSVEELAELEKFVRNAKQARTAGAGHSVFDIKPSSLGQMLRPLGTREEWYDEMLEGRV
jgi:Cu2+-containing amine oxidase